MDKVQFVKGDALHPEDYRGLLSGCTAVVHSIGILTETSAILERVLPQWPSARQQTSPKSPAPTYDSAIYQSTKVLLAEAEAAHVEAFLYISASDPPPYTMRGYIAAKRKADEAVLASQQLRPIVFRPSLIYGPERWFTTPLSTLFSFLQRVGVQGPADTPLAGTAVGRAAVNAIQDRSVRGLYLAPDIARLAEANAPPSGPTS